MTASAHDVLEAGRVLAGLSLDELWLAYFALGGAATPAELGDHLAGVSAFVDYDVVAQAINERFFDLGQNHPLPYGDELADGSPGTARSSP